MASCFDISIIDAWNTGDENVTNGSVDDYDFDWGSGCCQPEEEPSCRCRRNCCTCQLEEEPSCRCRRNCCTCQPVEEPPADDECVAEEAGEDYPVIQL